MTIKDNRHLMREKENYERLSKEKADYEPLSKESGMAVCSFSNSETLKHDVKEIIDENKLVSIHYKTESERRREKTFSDILSEGIDLDLSGTSIVNRPRPKQQQQQQIDTSADTETNADKPDTQAMRINQD